jgi:LysM repeat protein
MSNKLFSYSLHSQWLLGIGKRKAILLIIFLVLCSFNLSAQFFGEDSYEEFLLDEQVFNRQKPDTASSVMIDSLIAYSQLFIGTPYRYGGMSTRGFDCSGFVNYVFNHFGIALQRRASLQYIADNHIDMKNLKKGDLVFFGGRSGGKRIGHVGIVASDSLQNGVFSFIHASVTRGITISKSTESYYKSRYLSACRVIAAKDNASKSNNTNEPVQNDYQYHILLSGETLYALSNQYGTAVDSIRKWNNIGDNIKTGQRLIVSKNSLTVKNDGTQIADNKSVEQKKAEKKPQTTTYIVKQGDTLYKIAQKYGTTVGKLKKDNDLNSSNLKISQKILIKR